MPGSWENIHSTDSCFSYLCLGCAHKHGTILGGREEAREGSLLLTPFSFCCPGMLSCCLLGACGSRDQAVQLLPVPCLNQPLVEFVLHQRLELLLLIPETETSAGKYGKITFIYSIILLPHLHYPNKPPDVSGRARLHSWTLQRQPEKVFNQVNAMIVNPKGRTWWSWRSNTKFPIPPPQSPCSRAASTFPSENS